MAIQITLDTWIMTQTTMDSQIPINLKELLTTNAKQIKG
jgi:hypothetical protein